MDKKRLYNKINKSVLIESLKNEKFKRITASFYKYIIINEPQKFRDFLYISFHKHKIFGRIYIAVEGINAQVSVPEKKWVLFLNMINQIKELRDIHIKKALQEGNSFYKLTIKVREELVAYNLLENEYDIDKVGRHLDSEEYNSALDNPNTTIVDMRNYYESEVGQFKNAIIPDAETSKELLPKVKKLLKGKERDKILLYCTGGIRCEKASSYLIKNGFKDINQLQGGIIQYAHDMKEKNIKSKFIGKNFVFDNRLGERVTDDVISKCHICQESCDNHTDCKNDACHILFIQCEKCNKKFRGCCSDECKNFTLLPNEDQKKRRKNARKIISKTFFDSRIKPKLRS